MENDEYLKLYAQHKFKWKFSTKKNLCLYCALTDNDFKRLSDDMKRFETADCVAKQEKAEEFRHRLEKNKKQHTKVKQ